MRLPKLRELTEEQKRVYLYAPVDKHVLVQGPPGTGKTLIACLRAIELKKKKVPVVLGMFNRVLMTYTSNTGKDLELPTQTVLNWFRDWWSSSGLPPHSSPMGRIAIQAEFKDKDMVKEAGARWYPNEWKPWGGRPGVWMINADQYFANPQCFKSWKLWHSPPMIDGKPNCIDWAEVSTHIMNNEESICDESLNLGIFLVDEGQDFPPGLYKFLRQLSVFGNMRKVQYPLRCFVLADENQQLTEENSTLTQIAESLRVSEENRYQLLDNFRNSKEIAELAKHFFADVGVMPRLPTRSAEKPVYSIVDTRSSIVERIKIWLTNNPRKEIGVLVFNEETRAEMTSILAGAVSNMRGRNVTVQTYSWKSRQENPAQDLKFDVPDIITVLNMQSCKGLEFDAVFIVDSHEAQIGIYGVDRYKMQMFVAVSRAREWVHLIDAGSRAGHGAYHEHLPGEEYLGRDHDVGAAVTPPRVARSGGQSKVRASDTRSRSVKDINAVDAADWVVHVMKLAHKQGLVVNDYRHKGGALWVSGGPNLANQLEPLGFKYKADRAGWWRKQ